jgi:hypothetical protein
MDMLLTEFLAQSSIVNQILRAIDPFANLPWALMCWIILLSELAAMLLQKQGSLMLTFLLFIGMITAFINILGSNNLGATITTTGVFADMLQSNSVRFGNWLVMIAMMVSPLVFAGMTKTGRSRLPAIIAFVVAAGYLFFRYAIMPK